MSGERSSPQVRACLQTLKELGAVYKPACIRKGNNPTLPDVLNDIWPRSNATGRPAREGRPHDHAEHAWSVAQKFATSEQLDLHPMTKLPFKVSSYGRSGHGPGATRSGATSRGGQPRLHQKERHPQRSDACPGG
eukprot:2328303-Heterocapsa_arctica.AAC.1